MVRGSKAVASKPKSKAPPTAKDKQKGTKAEPAISTARLELRQKCLNIFRDVLAPGGEDKNKVLQEVKGHLYNRDFATAFGRQEYLQVYASRWSPSRALCYLEVFSDIQMHLVDDRPVTAPQPYQVVCLGGGAGAEVVGLAAWKSVLSTASTMESVRSTFIDIADWGAIVEKLYAATVTPPHLSKYASAALQDANVAMLSSNAYIATFERLDALELDEGTCQKLFSETDLVTLLFTLNELYSTSIAKTQQLLAQLTATMRPGSHLLVVDSPGSYSTVSINGTEKKYPMQWLLDHTLLGHREQNVGDAPVKWSKIVSDESKWFRLERQGLEYPMELENMRYQIHLYRRLVDSV